MAGRTPRGKERDSGEADLSVQSPAEAAVTWDEQVAQQPEGAFAAYDLKRSFTQGALIAHSSFGKGIVARVEGKRIEVLFREGRKKLVHAG